VFLLIGRLIYKETYNVRMSNMQFNPCWFTYLFIHSEYVAFDDICVKHIKLEYLRSSIMMKRNA